MTSARAARMTPSSWDEQARRNRLDRTVLLMIVGFSVVLLRTSEHLSIVTGQSIEIQLVINSAITVVALMAAIQQLGNRRDLGDPGSYLLGCAFLTFAAANGVELAISIIHAGTSFGLSIEAPGQAPEYGWIVIRAVVAVLFAVSARAEQRRWPVLPGWAALLGAAGVFVGAAVLPVAALVVTGLPQAIQPLPGSDGLSFAVTPWVWLVDLVIVVILAVAAWRYRVVYARDGSRRAAYLAIALVVELFIILRATLQPAPYLGILTGEDALQLLFYVFLVLAFQAEEQAVHRDVVASHARLAELQGVELARAVLEERARLARDIHDGLTQELWLARLRVDELADVLDESPEQRIYAIKNIQTALDAATAEARHFIAASSGPPGGSGDFLSSLTAYVESVGDRLGLPVTMDVQAGVDGLPSETSAEVMRIVQEALANVRRHAAASKATVSIRQVEGRMRIAIEDDGKGMPAEILGTGHGLTSMGQRARTIGGELQIERLGRGTRVVVEFPVAAPMSA